MNKINMILLGALLSLNAWADLSIADFEKNSKPQSVNAYILGLSSGLNSANTALAANNQPPLYCFPPYLNLTLHNIREIISAGTKEYSDVLVKPSVDEILLKKLSTLYPCGYD